MGVRDLHGSVVFCLFFLVLPSFPGKGMVFGDRCERPIIGLCSFSYQPMYCISVFRIMMMIFGGCERPDISMGCHLSFVVFSLFFISALASLLSFHLTICNLVFEYISGNNLLF